MIIEEEDCGNMICPFQEDSPILRDGKEFWFTFGLKKAQAILENIDQLRKWVDEKEIK